MDIKQWQGVLNKAFSLKRPRGVRFQFFTDWRTPESATGSIELWVQGGKKPKGCQTENQLGQDWYGFVDDAVPHDITEAQAVERVAALFIKFGA